MGFKNGLGFLLLAALFGGPITAFSQTGDDDIAISAPELEALHRKECGETLMELMKMAPTRQYGKVGAMMIYSGPDLNRQLKSPMNMMVAHEKLEVINTTNEIAHYLEISKKHFTFDNFRTVSNGTIPIYIYDVTFQKEKGKAKVLKFSFVPYKGKYFLLNIE